MLGTRRVVVVRADAWLAGGRGALTDEEVAALEAYARDPTSTTTLAFVAAEVDRRLKAVKVLEQAAEVVRCDPLSEGDAAAWVARRVADGNRRISRRAAQLLVALVGTDLSRLDTELEKVLAYGAGAPVLDEEHVQAVASASGTARIFDLLDAVAEGRGSDALRQLRRLLAGGEPPLRILATLSRQMRTLLLVRLLLDRGHGAAEIQRRLGVHPYVVRKAVQQVAALGVRELAAGLLACVETETDVKTGRQSDEAALELLIARLVSRKLQPAFRQRSG